MNIPSQDLMSNTFEWPTQSELRLETLDNLADSRLCQIDYHVGGSIWSLQLTMTGGRKSPVFGTRNVIDASVQIDPELEIGQI